MSTDPQVRRTIASEFSRSEDQGFAVLELFTSEGCSSCPSADELLAELAAEAREGMLPVYPLGFHVNYWDSLGWVDRFATEANTVRQRRYAQAFGSGGMYTPQLVVNGDAELVGSHARQARWLITSALRVDVPTMSLAMVAAGDFGLDPHVTVAYEVDRPRAGAVINVAVVESDLMSDVTRGENAGRTLRHANVVRAFRSVPLEASPGRVVVDIPSDLVAAHASVVTYVQDDGTMRILAATGADLADDEQTLIEGPAAAS